MSSRPILSILLPVFNGSRYLDAQLFSILDQTHEDYELLIYDDGSADDSADIIGRFASRDARIRVFSSKTNCGQSLALRLLLAESRGDLVMFSDQDDVWEARKTEILLKAIGDATMAYGISELIDAEGRSMGKSIFDFVGSPLAGRDQIDLLFHNTVSGHAMLVRREIVEPSLFQVGIDYDWLIAVLATYRNGVVYEPTAITFHRQHQNNQVNVFGRPRPPKPPQSGRWHRIMRMHAALGALVICRQLAPEKRSLFNRLLNSLREDVILSAELTNQRRKFSENFVAAMDQLQVPTQDQKTVGRIVRKICRSPLHPKTIKEALRNR